MWLVRTVLILLLGLLALHLPQAVGAQALPTQAEVDDGVEAVMREQGIPGLALAVVRGGEVVAARGYGLRDVENGLPVTATTLFETASIAKPLFAIAILQQVEAGRVALDDFINLYLPELPGTWAGITVRHLLTHTAGLPYSVDVPTVWTASDLLQAAAIISPEAAPGERWTYSDFGYQLLAVILERVTGYRSADYLSEAVFAPAGMTTAVISATLPEQAALGYRPHRDGVAPTGTGAPDQPLLPGEGIYLSLNDYIAWDAALSSGALLGTEALDVMYTSGVLGDGSSLSYGLGWTVRSVDGSRVVEHGGGSLQVVNRFVRYLDADLSVIMLSNLAFSAASSLPYAVAALYDPKLAEPEPAPSAAAIDDPFPEVTALLRTVFEGMLDGTLDRALFTDEAQASFYEELLAAGSDLQSVGLPRSYTFVEYSEADGLRTYRYEVDITVRAFVTVVLDRNGKIASFEIGL